MSFLTCNVIGVEALAGKFNASIPAVQSSVAATMLKAAIMVQRLAKQKVSGEVLNVVSNKLRTSISAEVVTTGGVIVGIVGSNVKYAAIHEYGFAGKISVSAHVRRSVRQMKSARRNKLGNETSGSKLKGKGTGVINVRSFERTVNYPERSFIRSSLKELTPEIRAMVSKATIKTIQGALK